MGFDYCCYARLYFIIQAAKNRTDRQSTKELTVWLENRIVNRLAWTDIAKRNSPLT